MRILIVSQYFYPENFKINDLALSLKARGHDISILTALPNYPSGNWFKGYAYRRCGAETWQGMSLFRLPIFRRRQGKGWQLACNYLSFVLSGCVLAPWWLRKKEFDVIFVYEPSPFTVAIPAMLLRRLKKAPLLFWVQDLWPESLKAAGAVHSEKILSMVGHMVRWIYRHCDRVLVQSEAFIHPAVQAGARQEHTHYYPNWAENLYQPLAPNTPSPVPLPKGFKIMFAGNLGEAQALATIVAAATALQHETTIQWLMLGDGRRMAWMQQAVQQQGLGHCIHFLGRHPVEDMPAFFAQADSLLVTLKADEVFAHTIPCKVQSYMACAKPIIAALNGEGARVIQAAHAGFSVAAEDAEALAKVVLKMANLSPEQRQQLGSNAHQYYTEHFDRDTLVTQLEVWMETVKKEGLCASSF